MLPGTSVGRSVWRDATRGGRGVVWGRQVERDVVASRDTGCRVAILRRRHRDIRRDGQVLHNTYS